MREKNKKKEIPKNESLSSEIWWADELKPWALSGDDERMKKDKAATRSDFQSTGYFVKADDR